jgi:hypothetical protein
MMPPIQIIPQVMVVEKLVGALTLVKLSLITMITALDGTMAFTATVFTATVLDGTIGVGIVALDGTMDFTVMGLDGIVGLGMLVSDGTTGFMAMALDGTIGVGMVTMVTNLAETTVEII